MRLIRVSELPAVEAALVRFDLWWSGLSRRERILVGVAAALLAGVVLVYGVIKPIQSARAAAIADIRTYETLNARILAAGRLGPATARRSGPAADVATGAGTSFGLVVTAEPIPGGVRASIADASYDSVMAWLADLSATSALGVARVEIVRRPAPGRVSATVDFTG
jgi:general secretion pathway protein M